MADAKLSALTELAAAPATGDEIYIRDISEAASAESKRITVANLIAAVARHSTFYNPHSASGTGVTLAAYSGDHTGTVFGDSSANNQGCVMEGAIPSDFTTLRKAVFVCWTDGADGNVRIAFSSHFGGSGEARDANTDSIAEATIALTQKEITEIDMTGTLTGLAAGDYFSMNPNRAGAHGADTIADLFVIGLLIEWD